jgi:ethanolamine permease
MLAMLSLIALRRKDPNTHRPYRVPGYPFVPALAMVLAMVTFVLIGIYWIKLMLIYLGILLICFIVYKIFYKK